MKLLLSFTFDSGSTALSKTDSIKLEVLKSTTQVNFLGPTPGLLPVYEHPPGTSPEHCKPTNFNTTLKDTVYKIAFMYAVTQKSRLEAAKKASPLSCLGLAVIASALPLSQCYGLGLASAWFCIISLAST